MFDLTGRVALITGGNGGIGLGMAQGLAACGARIILTGRRAEKNTAALAALPAAVLAALPAPASTPFRDGFRG